MTVADSARSNRMMLARWRCEAVDHADDCPRGVGIGGYNDTSRFVLHHIVRRNKDRDSVLYPSRDELENLRFVYNGATGLGAGGCHRIIHDDPDKARQHGLIAPRPVHTLSLDPTGTYWITATGKAIA